MGLFITLRSGDGDVVRQIADPLGGTFDASGDFDELLGSEVSPRLNRVDPEGSTILSSSEMSEISVEVDALLRTIPDDARSHGRQGQAWRGLVRFQAMVELCAADDRSSLLFTGD